MTTSPNAQRWLTAQPDTIILQPTTLCPLNCGYCYLPQRHRKLDMTVDVARAVAAEICPNWSPIEIVWHDGEPLAVGPARFVSRSRVMAGSRGSHERVVTIAHRPGS